MLDTDDDLPTLIAQNDHLNVLRYIRLHQIRNPELVITTGKAWLGEQLDRNSTAGGELARLTAVEQICLAALDLNQRSLAELCLKRLHESDGTSGASVTTMESSSRFRLLQGRCLEAAGDYDGAKLVYDALLQENPSNLQAMKRIYCLLKAQVGHQDVAAQALNEYLQQNGADTAAWYELAQVRQELGDYAGAAFALEEVLLSVPTDSKVHIELAECLVTSDSTNLETLKRARQHMAQALELNPLNRRAQLGLVSISNAYLIAAETAVSSKKDVDEHEVAVTRALVQYGAEQVVKSYKGSKLLPIVTKLLEEYTAE